MSSNTLCPLVFLESGFRPIMIPLTPPLIKIPQGEERQWLYPNYAGKSALLSDHHQAYLNIGPMFTLVTFTSCMSAELGTMASNHLTSLSVPVAKRHQSRGPGRFPQSRQGNGFLHRSDPTLERPNWNVVATVRPPFETRQIFHLRVPSFNNKEMLAR